jgi:hypothetical protein
VPLARALASGLLSDRYRSGVRLGYRRPVAIAPKATFPATIHCPKSGHSPVGELDLCPNAISQIWRPTFRGQA